MSIYCCTDKLTCRYQSNRSPHDKRFSLQKDNYYRNCSILRLLEKDRHNLQKTSCPWYKCIIIKTCHLLAKDIDYNILEAWMKKHFGGGGRIHKARMFFYSCCHSPLRLFIYRSLCQKKQERIHVHTRRAWFACHILRRSMSGNHEPYDEVLVLWPAG